MAVVRILQTLLFSAVALLLTSALRPSHDDQQSLDREEQLAQLFERLDNYTKSTIELWEKEVRLKECEARSQTQQEEIVWLRSLVTKLTTTHHAPIEPTIPTQETPVEATSSSSPAVSDEKRDCLTLYNEGFTADGVYQFHLPGNQTSFNAYCDMSDGGGWMRILVRQVQTRQLNFKRPFAEYKKGFGDAKGEYWIGNDILHYLTHKAPHELRIRVYFTGQREYFYGEWSSFMVGDEESQYKLSVGGFNYSSTQPDAISDSDGRKFVTTDRNENGKEQPGHCVEDLGGGGWWYARNCFLVNPTGPFSRFRGGDKSGTFWSGDAPGGFFSSENIIIKIRPRS